jgi:hypothetical protein
VLECETDVYFALVFVSVFMFVQCLEQRDLTRSASALLNLCS